MHILLLLIIINTIQQWMQPTTEYERYGQYVTISRIWSWFAIGRQRITGWRRQWLLHSWNTVTKYSTITIRPKHHCQLLLMPITFLIARDHSFLQKKFCEFHMAFCGLNCGLLWEITVNSEGNSQLKENQFCCSKYPIYWYYLLALTVSFKCQLVN